MLALEADCCVLVVTLIIINVELYNTSRCGINHSKPQTSLFLGFDGQNLLRLVRLAMFVMVKPVLGQAVVRQKHQNQRTMQIYACNAVAFQLKMAEMDCFWGHGSFFSIPAGMWNKCVRT